MPRWKPRDPSIYPVAYTDTVLKAQAHGQPIFLSRHLDSYSARVAADRFREWRFCLRECGSPAHRAWIVERDWRITLTTRAQGGAWELWVGVVPRRLAGFERANPHLANLINGV